MFARTTEVQAEGPSKIDDGIAVVRDEIFPTVTSIDGCVGMSLLVNRGTGRCIATTAWSSEDAMWESRERVLPLRARAERALGASGSEVHLWEVAAVHRDHSSPHGARARLTWLSGDPGSVDRAIDTYRMAVLPRLEMLEGFCSASLMVDRAAGLAVGTVVFDDQAALDATREDAHALRTRVATELGATVDHVEEMELSFAHLHVPEMA